ncbi:hypothetical protein ES708_24011 [subsurface metagenome]
MAILNFTVSSAVNGRYIKKTDINYFTAHDATDGTLEGSSSARLGQWYYDTTYIVLHFHSIHRV